MDIWYRKRLLYQLSHNHFPFNQLSYLSFFKLGVNYEKNVRRNYVISEVGGFPCDICNKVLGNRSSYRGHMKIHEKERAIEEEIESRNQTIDKNEPREFIPRHARKANHNYKRVQLYENGMHLIVIFGHTKLV